MSGFGTSTGLPVARHALFLTAQAALTGMDVAVWEGFQWPPDPETAWAAMTDASSDVETETLSPRLAQEESITLHMSIGAWNPGFTAADEKTAFDRAFSILAAIQQSVRADPTLGDAVLWCLPGNIATAGSTTEDDSGEGRLIEIDAQFIAHTRMRRV